MALLIIMSVVLGAVLGRFFKVLVLLPSCALIVAAVVDRSAALEHGLVRTILEIAILNAALQISYVCSLLTISTPEVSQRQGTPAHAPPLLRH